MVRILGFHCCGPCSNPGWRTEIPQTMWCSQKKKKKKCLCDKQVKIELRDGVNRQNYEILHDPYSGEIILAF